MTSASPPIAPILERALAGEPPAADEIEALLATHEPAAVAELFAAASEVRGRRFGDAVFLYGFVYFSTYCRNDCTFCLYRASNPDGPRYRKSLDEVVAVSRDLARSGVHLIDLTMGEDPLYGAGGEGGGPDETDAGGAGGGSDEADARGGREFEALVALVTAVKAATGLPVMVSPGVVPARGLAALAATGAEWYACYQETHARALFERLRIGQDFGERARARLDAARAGMLVEDGALLGAGETLADRALTVNAMRREPIDQVRVMTFVPQPGTPLADTPPSGRLAELVTIATMRLAMPDRLIPASLDVDGIAGLESRIAAGANVVTSLVPPHSGLAGVSQSELDIDEGLRTAPVVTGRLAAAGLRVATAAEYADWVAAARERRGAPADTAARTP
ncbi:MAG TPA: radical SAM protein [Thermoleophilia bacterium]|nr:radical SAM protein [Thermoleophilia bacterium]